MARHAQQGHRPPDRLQLRSLYGKLNRQDHGDVLLRHEGRQATFDELQLRHQHGILLYLTISLSLCNTGTTTLSKNSTRTRKRSLRELPPLPLLLFPLRGSGGRLGGIVGCHCLHELLRPARLERSEAREGHERHELRLHHLPLLSPLPLLLLLLLLHLQRQVLLEEESEGGAVDAVVAAQRRHHQERSVPRGVPHGAVTPLRPGVKETARPHPRVRCVLSPWSVVLLVHLTLPGSGACLLAP